MAVDTPLTSVLDARPYELDEATKGPLFRTDLLAALAHHRDQNSLFAKFCKKHNFNPDVFDGDLAEIPAIPVSVFKALGPELASVPKEKIFTQLQSSATSGVPSTIPMDRITAKRQTRAMVRVMQEVLGTERRPFFIMDVDPAGPGGKAAGARTAAIKGYLNFASGFEFFIEAADKDAPLVFQTAKFLDRLQAADQPLVIFGFTFVLYHTVFRPLAEAGHRFTLPPGSQVIHIGGWKKLEAQKVSKEKFNADIAALLEIPKRQIIDIYGFTEQMGLNYPDCPEGFKHVPAYAEVLVRKETDQTLCPPGEPGLLEFLSPLPHSYPGNVVLTDDIGVIEPGACPCGRLGTRFKILGRAAKAEVRGCGEIMADQVMAPVNPALKEPNSKSNGLQVHLAPCDLPDEDAGTQLKAILDQLESRKAWLAAQPTEALIGLMDQARQRWAEDPALTPYAIHGLNHLVAWCTPHRLRRLLDAGLSGRRGHGDLFLPREDLFNSSKKAFPCGLAAHWLSGNVPLLGMFALVQGILTKNVNILKVAAGESQALPRLLESFRDLEYTSPGGMRLSGKDLLSTLAVVYFDRNETSLAAQMSEAADIRIAWGGREAMDAVSGLPRKFACRDLLYGPKLSLMVIGAATFDTDKGIRKILRRAATDVSVFDQFACASPHTIFVEKGGRLSPEEFAEKLGQALDKALTRLPCAPPGPGAANQIRGKLAEYAFMGQAFHDDQLRWTVLFEEDNVPVDPTYHRVVTVKAVDSALDILPHLPGHIQTIGLALDGPKKLEFAHQAALQGVVRFPDVGRMTHFDQPWDGISAVGQMVRWVTLGGPL